MLLAHIVRMAAALTGKSWAEDRYTRELTFGLILQRLNTMLDDPTNALLADEARRAREHFLRHAWRALDAGDPFVGMSATHLRSKPDEAEQAPNEQAPEPTPVRSRKSQLAKPPAKTNLLRRNAAARSAPIDAGQNRFPGPRTQQK